MIDIHDPLEESPKIRLIVWPSGSASTWQLFAIKLALILIAGRLLGEEPPKFVIFDNDFYGPASSDLQAAALLLTNPEAKVLGLTVVTGGNFIAIRQTVRACPLSFEFPGAGGLLQLEPAATQGRCSISASPLVFPR